MSYGKDLKSVETAGAPAPIGPYSQAVLSGGFLFVSGQVPLIPGTGVLAGDDISLQTEQVIDNIQAVLSAEGLSLDDVVKAEVFMRDLSDFGKMNEIYASRFTGDVKPARFVVEVSRLPKDSLIEIACTVKVR